MLGQFVGLPQENTTPGDSNHRDLFSHCSGGWKPKVEVSAGLVAPKASLLTVLTWPFLSTSQVSLPLL